MTTSILVYEPYIGISPSKGPRQGDSKGLDKVTR